MPATMVRDTRSTGRYPPRSNSMPTRSSPRSRVFGTDPTRSSACVPSTVRPSESVTRTPSSVRSTCSARACFTSSTPRSASASSSTSAASSSSYGSIRSRLETSVTGTPISVKARTNSAPVTPDPTTTRCSGRSVEVVDLAPVEDAFAVGFGAGEDARAGAGRNQHDLRVEHPVVAVREVDVDRCARHPLGRRAAPGPSSTRTPSRRSFGRMSADCAVASFFTRMLTRGSDDRGVVGELDVDAQVVGPAQVGAQAGGGDERLGRHAVEQHARTAVPSESTSVTGAADAARRRGPPRSRPVRRR